MEFQTKLALASYLLKGREMSQAAAAAAQGEMVPTNHPV